VSPKKATSKSEAKTGIESTSELAANKKLLVDVIERAQDGDEEALKALKRVLDEVPKVARIVDLARDAERGFIKKMSGGDVFTQEAIPRNLEAMRREIAGENPPALERLLAERITVCWLELQYFEAIYTQNLGNMTISQGDYHQRRIDKAHRRYLSSIKALAQTRKMGPAVQINIADKQINTAG
jgi:hypothetical protein